jgi:hypothetical protein
MVYLFLHSPVVMQAVQALTAEHPLPPATVPAEAEGVVLQVPALPPMAVAAEAHPVLFIGNIFKQTVVVVPRAELSHR